MPNHVALDQTSVDLRPNCPPVQDQQSLGSCTANAVEVALWFDLLKQQSSDAGPLSRLFIYYNTRAAEGTVDSDAGASLRDTIKSVASWGAPQKVTGPMISRNFPHHRYNKHTMMQ